MAIEFGFFFVSSSNLMFYCNTCHFNNKNIKLKKKKKKKLHIAPSYYLTMYE